MIVTVSELAFGSQAGEFLAKCNTFPPRVTLAISQGAPEDSRSARRAEVVEVLQKLHVNRQIDWERRFPCDPILETIKTYPCNCEPHYM